LLGYLNDFRRLGARVPTIAVSPWIPPATLDLTPYGHVSIPRTVRTLFAPGASLLSAQAAKAVERFRERAQQHR
jgi:hypothetical protein